MQATEENSIELEYKKLKALQRRLNHLNFVISAVFISINIAIFIKLLKAGNRDIASFDKTLEIIGLLACALLVASDLTTVAYISKKKKELKAATRNPEEEAETDKSYDKLKTASMHFSLAASIVFFLLEIVAVASLFGDFPLDSPDSKLPLNVGSIASTFAFSLALISVLLSAGSKVDRKKESNKYTEGVKIMLSVITLASAVIKGLEASGAIRIGNDDSILSVGYIIAISISSIGFFMCLYSELKPGQKKDEKETPSNAEKERINQETPSPVIRAL